MNRSTFERLRRINLEFYRDHAQAFDRSRTRPWSGWERLLERVSRPAPGARLSVLDLGCGNARFASFLHERGVALDYVGVDASASLLAAARDRLAPLTGVDAQLLEIDLLDTPLTGELGARRFDLVVAFGLLHHVPSHAARRALLAEASFRASPEGWVAVAFWQFGAEERFRRRFVSWEVFNLEHDDPVDPAQLEPHDHLVAWGDGDATVRYCHWTTPDEARRLVAEAELAPVDVYPADGANGELNLYVLARVRSSRDAGSRRS